MDEFDETLTVRELHFLRSNTILGPVALLKIDSTRVELGRIDKWYQKIEGVTLSGGYNLADDLEYNLRFEAWKNKCAEAWQKCDKNTDLASFSKAVMDKQIESALAKKRTRKLKMASY